MSDSEKIRLFRNSQKRQQLKKLSQQEEHAMKAIQNFNKVARLALNDEYRYLVDEIIVASYQKKCALFRSGKSTDIDAGYAQALHWVINVLSDLKGAAERGHEFLAEQEAKKGMLRNNG